MASQIKELKGVEIFAAGRWNGMPFTTDDLDTIVRSFNGLDLAGRVPLKLGHDGPDARQDPTSQFAMGWVQRIYRDGSKLLADVEVPAKVADLIDQKYLKFVSIELLQNVQASSRVIPWVLDAVALLGADQPAVGILKDLTGLSSEKAFMTAAKAADLHYISRAEFTRESFTPIYERKKQMSGDNTPTLQELSDKLLGLTTEVAALRQENTALKTEKAAFKQTETRFQALQDEVRQDRVNRHRKDIKDLLEASVKSQDILPAARERFVKVYKVEDDEQVMEVSLDDVKEFIRENPNKNKKEPKKPATFSLAKFDDEVPAGLTPDQVVRLKAQAVAKEHGINGELTSEQLAKFSGIVFKRDPELAEAYRYYPDQHAAQVRAEKGGR